MHGDFERIEFAFELKPTFRKDDPRCVRFFQFKGGQDGGIERVFEAYWDQREGTGQHIRVRIDISTEPSGHRRSGKEYEIETVPGPLPPSDRYTWWGAMRAREVGPVDWLNPTFRDWSTDPENPDTAAFPEEAGG